ncbi:MAG: helix-turn-helix domain-containing protein [Planctomycetes bacterium]|nr:helix-turn-helix domain-containing protein [Planctomycetota bacterium]
MAENKNDEILLDGLERVSQSAAFLGVSRSQIYKWISEGVLPSVKIGHSRRVPIRSVRDLAAANLVFVRAADSNP